MHASLPTQVAAATQSFAALTNALMTTWIVEDDGCGMVSALRRKRVHSGEIYPHFDYRVNDFFKHHRLFLFKQC
jgi:hypothetical protein